MNFLSNYLILNKSDKLNDNLKSVFEALIGDTFARVNDKHDVDSDMTALSRSFATSTIILQSECFY